MRAGRWGFAWLVMLWSGWAAWADVTYPDRPPAGLHIVDGASLLNAADARAVEDEAAGLERDRGISLFVVTVRSLKEHGATDIENYALNLFNAWGIGSGEHNLGMLLVVAVDDRAARIQLGAGWDASGDNACQRIMDWVLVPACRSGRYSKGIREAVHALTEMARAEDKLAEPLAVASAPPWRPSTAAVTIGAILLPPLVVIAYVWLRGGSWSRAGNRVGTDVGVAHWLTGGWSGSEGHSSSHGDASDGGHGACGHSDGGHSDGGGASGHW